MEVENYNIFQTTTPTTNTTTNTSTTDTSTTNNTTPTQPPPLTQTPQTPTPTKSSSTSGVFYRGTDKSLARLAPRYILFDGENISFDSSLVIYINSTNIPAIMIINKIHETQNLLSL
jgi:hypothetical protein